MSHNIARRKSVTKLRALGSAATALALFATSNSVMAQDAAADEAEFEEVVVTGSRIVRKDLVANSPVVTIDTETLHSRADVTLDTFLNTLPQVNPSGTTTSNNPGNGGQSNINLRGLGPNRNLVLVDGRRVMVSASNMTVDLNTIPAALIESIEISTGGAGAAYGADAIAGAVNLKLKRDFEGIDFRANYSNATAEWDAEEYNATGVIGGNFGDDRGNAVFAFDYTKREQLIKSQRPFAAVATQTTTFFPEGHYFEGANAPTQAAVDSVFESYGVAPGSVTTGVGRIGFNTDGTLFSAGQFNSSENVENWRYPVDLSVNTNLFPDVYSYNFDAVNLLVLPLERKTFSTKLNYELTEWLEVFASGSWTNYDSQTALAPTPFLLGSNPSSLVEAGQAINFQLVVPVTNPFIPEDFKTLLDSRTGDNPALVGSGATEPFTMRQRSLWGGLRSQSNEYTVVQYMAGFHGEIADNWRWEIYGMEGKTTRVTTQGGQLRNDRLQELLEAPDGGASICAGGYNPFGRNDVSQACRDYIVLESSLKREFKQQILQAYVTGEAFELPAGPVSLAFGAEIRRFNYFLDPGAAASGVSGFGAVSPAAGKNRFKDIFAEAYIPLASGAPFADQLDITLGYRLSNSKFEDVQNSVVGESRTDSAFKAELSWSVDPAWPRIRASYQRAVRAPNFAELFDGNAGAPQYFDPCSVGTDFRNSGGQAATDICAATGVNAPDTYVNTPGIQLSVTTDGNTDLKPETGTTFTLGMVYSAAQTDRWTSRFVASLDYYNIKVKDQIVTPHVNLFIADCYNYYGNNPELDANYSSCTGLGRFGADIFTFNDPSTTSGNFEGINGGFVQTAGFDFNAAWGFDLEWLGASPEMGTIDLNLQMTHTMKYDFQSLDFVPVIDYAGTAAYFGSGLGQSFPKWKANFAARWSVSDFVFDMRGRYISGMKSRAAEEFKGETFKEANAAWYWDTSLTYNVTDEISIRAGVNNLFDRKPELYSPNVQSGTDPSLYDVVGRRVTFSTNIRF